MISFCSSPPHLTILSCESCFIFVMQRSNIRVASWVVQTGPHYREELSHCESLSWQIVQKLRCFWTCWSQNVSISSRLEKRSNIMFCVIFRNAERWALAHSVMCRRPRFCFRVGVQLNAKMFPFISIPLMEPWWSCSNKWVSGSQVNASIRHSPEAGSLLYPCLLSWKLRFVWIKSLRQMDSLLSRSLGNLVKLEKTNITDLIRR